ncbi:hypothetical protein J2Y70_001020 [Xanthomonas translucens]|nr:hypothetical protein [Xanthomonas translucens]
MQASMASALSGLRQRCRGHDDTGLRQASMARLQSGKTRWRRPRNLAARRLSRRDRDRTTAHWTTPHAFVYQPRRHTRGIAMQLPPHRHRAAAIAMPRWRWELAGSAMPAAHLHGTQSGSLSTYRRRNVVGATSVATGLTGSARRD